MIAMLRSALNAGRWTQKVLRPFCFSSYFFGAALAVTFLSIEGAHVSEVFYEDSRSTLEDQVQSSKEIVIVEGGKLNQSAKNSGLTIVTSEPLT